MKEAMYIESSSFVTQVQRKKSILPKIPAISRLSKNRTNKKKPSVKMIAIALIAGIFGSLSIPFIAQSQTEEAHAFDITQFMVCEVLTDVEGVRDIYDFTQTSNLQFELLSKSAVGSGKNNVDAGFNTLIGFFNGGFDKINEPIIGYKITPDAEDTGYVAGDGGNSPEDRKERYNQGVKVSPYDRFGIAGLKFTSYAGEWKHVVVDACNPDKVDDPKAGLFYEDRLEPQSTWEDRDNSYDPRTIQYSKGIFSQFGVAFANVIANGLFNVTKSIVVMTNGAINFAFSDIAETFGLNDIIGGDNGVFSMLFKGVFQPLVFIMFVITAFMMLWRGLGKRQYRESLGMLVKSLILFFAAIIISVNPSFWIALPNNFAIIVQSVIISSMNTGLAGGNGLCTTDIGSVDMDLVNDPNADPQDILTQASENSRSSIGCQFWQMLLVKPWSQAQFGTDWNNLWAKDSIPAWAKNGKSIENTNEEMVGKAEVPLGAGEVINNWAIYHISAQTNVHSPTDYPGDRPKYSNEMANDWWRIVDALSNYEEDEKEFVVGEAPTNVAEGKELAEDFNKVTYTGPKTDIQVTEQWDDWTGNNSWNRVPTALLSIFVAGISLLAPFIFAMLAAIYAIGLAILVSVSPIMFLFGIWAGKGWDIFKSWAQLLLNTVLKRIATAILLVLSITFTSVGLKLMDDIGWFQGVLLLIVSTILLLKSRGKIMDAFASFNFSNYDMGAQSNRVKGMITKPVKDAGKLATVTVAGGVASRRHGGTFAGGMKAAGKGQLKNFGYENPLLRQSLMAYEAQKANKAGNGEDELANEFLSGQKNCLACGKVIAVQEGTGMDGETFIVHAGRTTDGNYLCYECYTDGDHMEAVEFIREFKTGEAAKAKEDKEKEMKADKSYLFAKRFTGYSKYNNAAQASDVVDSSLSNDERLFAFTQHATIINVDIQNFQNSDSDGISPAIPKEIEGYIDPIALETAWQTNKFDYVKMTYASAWTLWAQDNLEPDDDLLNSINADELYSQM